MLLSQSNGSGHHTFRTGHDSKCSSNTSLHLSHTLFNYVTSDTQRICLALSACSSGHTSTDEATLEHQHQVASGLADCCTDSGTESCTHEQEFHAPVPLFWRLWLQQNRPRKASSGSSQQCSPSTTLRLPVKMGFFHMSLVN